MVKDGPFDVGSNATVSGQEVLIALTGRNARLDFQAGSEVTLTSPTDGPYTSIQFLQHDEAATRGLTSVVRSTARLSFEGVMLLPTQRLEILGDGMFAAKSPNYTVIVDTLLMKGNGSGTVTTTTDNGRNLAVGPSTTIGGAAVLVR